MNCWPNAEQNLLLQAGLWDTPQAKISWNNYCKLVDLQKIDSVSTTFLPLVYRNLKQGPTPDSSGCSSIALCKSIYRHTWLANHIQLVMLKKALDLLHCASIQTCLLKGATMTLQYYQDAGLRSMGDVDILVSRSDAKQAIQLLMRAGWDSILDDVQGELDKFIHRTHAIILRNKEGHIVDLHWTILCESGIDQAFANYSYRKYEITPSRYSTVTVLGPEDQLLHTLVHGLRYSPQPLIRWVPDAVMILKKTPQFEWDYFLSQTKSLKIEFAVTSAIRYLRDHRFAEIPSKTMTMVDQYIPNAKELRYFKFIAKKQNKFTSIFKTYWYCHIRNSQSQNLFVLLCTLPHFVKRVQGLSHTYQLPLFVCYGLFMRFKKGLFITKTHHKKRPPWKLLRGLFNG